MTTEKLTLFVTLVALGPLVATGQNAKIESRVISGGGGTGSGGQASVTGTIGQAIGGGAAGGGAYAVRGGFHATLEVVPPEPGESFQAWMDGLAAEDLPPEEQRGPLDEPIGDGMSNLLKYALGLMPMTPSAHAAPRVVLVSKTDGGVERDYLGIEFERSINAAVEFELESSEAVSGWNTASFSVEIVDPSVGDNRERVRLVTGIPVEDSSRHFIRLHVTTP